jgi:hypothetical protein
LDPGAHEKAYEIDGDEEPAGSPNEEILLPFLAVQEKEERAKQKCAGKEHNRTRTTVSQQRKLRFRWRFGISSENSRKRNGFCGVSTRSFVEVNVRGASFRRALIAGG